MLKFIKSLIHFLMHHEFYLMQIKSAQATADKGLRGAREAQEFVKENLTSYADVSPSAKGESFVLLVGDVRGRDYVNFIGIPPSEFPELVAQLKKYNKYSRMMKIDMPHDRNFDSFLREKINEEY